MGRNRPGVRGFAAPGKERLMRTAEHAGVGVRHPLDPLTAGEIEAARCSHTGNSLPIG